MQQATKRPELHAVVEVAVRSGNIWVQLPPKPWPDFVRLCGSTWRDHVRSSSPWFPRMAAPAG